MPQFRPRPSVGGFRQAQGADIGRAISGVGGVLRGVAEGRQRAEIQDIAFQEELDRAQQVQVQNLDKSEVLKAKTVKRRARIDEISRINEEARANGNYENVLDDLDKWEGSYDTALMEDASPGFQALFPSQDAPIRAGKQNEMATTQASGNLQIMENNYVATLDALSVSVTPDMTPAEIVEDFDEAAEGSTSFGFLPGAAKGLSDERKADAMENLVKMHSVVDGLELLRDKDVQKSLGKERAEIVRGDLLREHTRNIEGRRVINETFKRTSNIDVMASVFSGAKQADVNSMILGTDELSPEDKKVALEFADSLYIRGIPDKEIDPSANHSFAENAMSSLIDQHAFLEENRDGLSGEELERRLLSLNDQAIEVIGEATRQNQNNAFKDSNYDDLVWSHAPIMQSLMILKQETPEEGLGEKLTRGFNALSPFDIKVNKKVRIPFAEVANISNEMVRGRGSMGHLSPSDKVLMRVLLADEAFKMDGSKDIADEATSSQITDEIIKSAQERLVSERFNLQGDAAQERIKQIFGARTEPARKTQGSSLSTRIRDAIASGFTIEELEAAARQEANFNQAEFDAAVGEL